MIWPKLGWRRSGSSFTEPCSTPRPSAASRRRNLLHFARCAKLDKATDTEAKFWYRSIKIAKDHLDQHVGETALEVVQDLRTRDHPEILNEG